jgi:hypothetical protein
MPLGDSRDKAVPASTCIQFRSSAIPARVCRYAKQLCGKSFGNRMSSNVERAGESVVRCLLVCLLVTAADLHGTLRG